MIFVDFKQACDDGTWVFWELSGGAIGGCG